MTIQGYGYAVVDQGSVWELDRQLSKLVGAGFTHAVIRPEGWQIWQNGQIDSRILARLKAVLDKHRSCLDYVMQLPTAINLFNLSQYKDHLRLLQQGVIVGKYLGVRLLLYQPGYRSDLAKTDFVVMSHLMKKERIVLHNVADEVAAWEGQIAIQTPYHGTDQCTSYAIWPDLLAQQVQQIDHPNLGLCLDFNQVTMAANWLGFDYVQAVQRLLPLAQHVHIQDLTDVLTTPIAPDVKLTLSVTYLPSGWYQLPVTDMVRARPHISAILNGFLEDQCKPPLLLNQQLFNGARTAVTI